MSNQFGYLDDYLAQLVYPALFERLDVAFPEFRWKRRGAHWTATQWPTSFPYHVGDERPDRLMVYASRPYWIKIHGHQGARFLDLVNDGRKPKGAEFPDAVRKLCELAGVNSPARTITPEQSEAAVVREAGRAILDTVTSYAQGCLWSTQGEDARSYIHERGFRDEEIQSLGFGLYGNVAEARKALADTGHDIAQAEEAGVLWERLEGYILIPWADDYARPLTIYGRWQTKAPPEGRPKTIALPGEGTKRSPLYFDRARNRGEKDLVLVEGVFDAALLQVKGDSRVVASVAAQLSGLQVETLLRHHIRSVYICGDPDGGGDRGTLANIAALEKVGIRAYVVPRLPEGMDPDEYVNAHGIEAWKDLVNHSDHACAFRARELLEHHRSTGETESVWQDRLLDEALLHDERTSDPRLRVDLDKHFWPVIRTALDLNEEAVTVLLAVRRRDAERKREERELQQQTHAHGRLLQDYKANLEKMGPEAALHQLHWKFDELRRQALRAKAEPIVTLAQEQHAHEQCLEKWHGRRYIGFPQKTLPQLDDATLGIRDITYVAAGPNVGKTDLCLQVGTDVVVHNSDVCFVLLSLEMTRFQIFLRMKSRIANIDWRRLAFGGELTEQENQAVAKAKRILQEIGRRVLILDAHNFPEPTPEKLVSEVQRCKAQTETSHAFVVVDYLQVFPIAIDEARHLHTSLDEDKYRVGLMRHMRDSLDDDDAVMVISEARKPSGESGKWGGALADIMGAARAGYSPDMVFLLTPFTDEELAKEFDLYDDKKVNKEDVMEKRNTLQRDGLSLVTLKIAKGRDGVTRKEIPLTFRFRRSDFTERTGEGAKHEWERTEREVVYRGDSKECGIRAHDRNLTPGITSLRRNPRGRTTRN